MIEGVHSTANNTTTRLYDEFKTAFSADFASSAFAWMGESLADIQKTSPGLNWFSAFTWAAGSFPQNDQHQIHLKSIDLDLEARGINFQPKNDACGWSRLILLRTMQERCASIPAKVQGGFLVFLKELFERGDLAEQATIIKSLPLLETPQQFCNLAEEVLQSDTQGIFECLALNNPYPALYFTEHSFNVVVLRTLYLDAPIEAIWGLTRRVNPRLMVMVSDYRHELESSSRPIKAGVYYVEQMRVV